MNQQIILDDIEYTLDKLICILSEEDYIAFINSDRLLKLYDMIIDTMNPAEVLSKETLIKIDKYVNLKYDLYKQKK